MNQLNIEQISSNIQRINGYLDTKSNTEIGEIFSKHYEYDIPVSHEETGKRIKENFKIIQEKDDFLRKNISSLSEDSKNFFFSMSSNATHRLNNCFRSFAIYIPEEFKDWKKSGGEIPYLFKIDQNILFIYSDLINLSNLSTISIELINKKISNVLEPKLKDNYERSENLIRDLELYKNEAASKKTKFIYRDKYEKYKRTVEVYELYIMMLIVLSVILVICQLFAYKFFDDLSVSNAITTKLTIIAVIATLFTYCFKQIGFYRQIAEQAHQTYMELEALPEYLLNLPEDKQNEIKADLAKKYFGQSIVDNPKGSNSSFEDQTKLNTEILKSNSALLDVVKKLVP